MKKEEGNKLIFSSKSLILASHKAKKKTWILLMIDFNSIEYIQCYREKLFEIYIFECLKKFICIDIYINSM